jgi:hypothetical protein
MENSRLREGAPTSVHELRRRNWKDVIVYLPHDGVATNNITGSSRPSIRSVGKRSREYLTDREVELLIEAAKQNRYAMSLVCSRQL